MTREELLLVQLMEECNEVAQAISKRLRFGKDHTHPSVKGTTTDRIMLELIDLCALVTMCEQEGILPFVSNMTDGTEQVYAKMQRVEEYLLLSKQEGILHEKELPSS